MIAAFTKPFLLVASFVLALTAVAMSPKTANAEVLSGVDNAVQCYNGAGRFNLVVFVKLYYNDGSNMKNADGSHVYSGDFKFKVKSYKDPSIPPGNGQAVYDSNKAGTIKRANDSNEGPGFVSFAVKQQGSYPGGNMQNNKGNLCDPNGTGTGVGRVPAYAFRAGNDTPDGPSGASRGVDNNGSYQLSCLGVKATAFRVVLEQAEGLNATNGRIVDGTVTENITPGIYGNGSDGGSLNHDNYTLVYHFRTNQSPPPHELEPTSSVSHNVRAPGEQVTFTHKIKNIGGQDATGIDARGQWGDNGFITSGNTSPNTGNARINVNEEKTWNDTYTIPLDASNNRRYCQHVRVQPFKPGGGARESSEACVRVERPPAGLEVSASISNPQEVGATASTTNRVTNVDFDIPADSNDGQGHRVVDNRGPIEFNYSMRVWNDNGDETWQSSESNNVLNGTNTVGGTPSSVRNMASQSIISRLDTGVHKVCTAISISAAHYERRTRTVTNSPSHGHGSWSGWSNVGVPISRSVDTNCKIVVKYPAFNAKQGDIITGGNYVSGASACTSSASIIRGHDHLDSIASTFAGMRASRSEYGLLPSGQLSNFGSAGGAEYARGLSFKNSTSLGNPTGQYGYFYGNIGGGPANTTCFDDVFGSYPTAPFTPAPSTYTAASASPVTAYTLSGGTLNINGSTLGDNQRRVLRLNGNGTVVVSGAIAYSGTTSADRIPMFALVADGPIDIRFAGGVTSTAGMYATRGNIHTCHDYSPVNLTVNNGICGNKLTIFGALIAGNSIKPYRTFTDYATPAADSARASAAEVVDLRGDLLIADYYRAVTTTQLRTIGERELPPRL